MLDICPEPIMNLYFHLELGFAMRDWEGFRQQFNQAGVLQVHSQMSGGTRKPYSLSSWYVMYTC